MGNIIALGQHIVKSYELVDRTENSDVYALDAAYTTQSSIRTLWHCRLAHLYQGAVITLAGFGSIGIQAMLSHNTERYILCLQGKMKWLPFRAGTRCRTRPPQLIQFDMFGPTRTGSINGSYYSLVITDDYTKKWDAECMSQKNQLMYRSQQWKARSERHFHSRGGYLLKAIPRTQGGEWASRAFKKGLWRGGDSFHVYCPVYVTARYCIRRFDSDDRLQGKYNNAGKTHTKILLGKGHNHGHVLLRPITKVQYFKWNSSNPKLAVVQH